MTRAEQLTLKSNKGANKKVKSPPAKKRKVLKRANKQRDKTKKQAKPVQSGWKETVDAWDEAWDYDSNTKWEQEADWNDEALCANV